MRARLIGQESGTAGTYVGVAVADALLIMRREVVADRERRSFQRQLQN